MELITQGHLSLITDVNLPYCMTILLGWVWRIVEFLTCLLFGWVWYRSEVEFLTFNARWNFEQAIIDYPQDRSTESKIHNSCYFHVLIFQFTGFSFLQI